ncbi:MAG TPA: protein kinase, partial [Thermoanaerobaculia bacterium]|nr:protein kinase [Thermoanaerobaculia bacterium]
MAAVYSATHRNGKRVALKMLHTELSTNTEVRQRFVDEGYAANRVGHPGAVSVIDDDVSEDGSAFLVMDLLEGETVETRLNRRGKLWPGEVLPIIDALLDVLAAAHDKGIVHRDLKPENLFITQDGRVKILDFGLARWSGDDVEADPHSPTRPGVVLGTAGYLSPEQVRAEALDERSDVFALGCLLYEMLTGHPAFLRGSTVESVVAVLQEDPPPFPPDGPADLCQLITSCLEKNREERLQKAHDVALFLDAVTARTRDSRPVSGVQAELIPERPSAWRRRWPVIVAAAAVPLAFVLGLLLRPAAVPPPELRFLTHSGRDRSPAASPDGRLVAFTSERDGRPRIWLEQLPGGDETPLTGGPDDFPRFSPDGGAILFARTEGLNSSLFRIPTLGGEPRRVVDDATDGDFSPDGSRIAFVRWKNAGGHMDSIVGIAHADGGPPRQLAVLPGRTLFHPRWSPDGREIAVVESGESPRMSVMIVDAESGRARELSGWSPPGVLSAPLWTRGGKSLAFAVSGSLAARQGASTRVVVVPRRGGSARTLFWNPSLVAVLDRLGDQGMVIEARTPRTELVEVGLRDAGAGRLTRGNSNDRQPVYSPDGRRIVFSSNRSGNLDVWALELATGSVRRLTDHPGDDWDPALMPDGRLLWSSNRSGHFEVWTA